jgi:hypothetical protein
MMKYANFKFGLNNILAMIIKVPPFKVISLYNAN